HYSGAAVWDQRNFTSLARLKAHSCSGRNIQAVSERSLAVELKPAIGLREMVMTADLDRSVSCVGNGKRNRRPILVENDLARCWKNFARYHFSPLLSLANWIVNTHQFGAIGKCRFHVNLGDHF